MGTIYKQQINQLTFLALEEETPKFVKFDMDLDSFKKFFKGILEGFSSVPFDSNIEEVKIISEHLYAAIKERDGKKFYAAIMEVLHVLMKLENTNEHCGVTALIKAIGVYATPYVGIAKLLLNLAENYKLYMADVKAGYHAFANKEWEKAGSSMGQFASTLLGWSTS